MRIPEVLESLTGEGLVLGAKRWAGIAFAPFALTASAGVLTLVGTTLLFRALPTDEAGRLALSLALLEILGLLGSLGLPNMITRLYGAAGRDAFDWPLDLAGTAALAVIPVTIGVLATSAVYDLPSGTLSFLVIGAILLVAINTGCFMLNAHGHYIWSSLLLRLSSAMLIVPGTWTFVAGNSTRLVPLLLFYSSGLALTLMILIWLLSRHLSRGSRRITLSQRLEATVFLASTGMSFLPDQGITAIAGALLRPETLALYAAMAVFARPFKLGTNILSMIMTPELVRRRRARYLNLTLGLWSLALLSSLGIALLGPGVAHWVYGGRYDGGLGLLPFLALGGALQLTVVLPRSDLGGRAPMALLRRLFLALAAVFGLLAILSAFMITTLGILGIAIAALALQVSRTLITYVYWWNYRRSEAS
jgi:O-antigen/teichoic acid export membrane protein